jgi:hypothetical protein
MSQSLELNQMTVEEKLQMMEALWADLSRNAEDVVPPGWHGEVLESRQAALERGDERFEDWQQARAEIDKATR